MRPTARLISTFIPVLALALAPPAHAQYFGRNAVQWERLKFEVLETDQLPAHGLIPCFQYSMTGQGKLSDTNYPSALRMPLWFIEGMAEYLSIGPVDPHTAMWLRDAARREKGLPTIRQLDNSAKYFPYRYGQALWACLPSRYG